MPVPSKSTLNIFKFEESINDFRPPDPIPRTQMNATRPDPDPHHWLWYHASLIKVRVE